VDFAPCRPLEFPGVIATNAVADATRYVANHAYTRAVLYFCDGSELEFEHSSREKRWVKASSAGSIADGFCLSLRLFRLNARHLQLFFEDGSDAEFFTNVREWKRWNGDDKKGDSQNQG
jgi:hypothetical protein